MTNPRANSRPTLPLIPDIADVRRHHDLTAGQANSDLFGGWGVRFSMRIW